MYPSARHSSALLIASPLHILRSTIVHARLTHRHAQSGFPTWSPIPCLTASRACDFTFWWCFLSIWMDQSWGLRFVVLLQIDGGYWLGIWYWYWELLLSRFNVFLSIVNTKSKWLLTFSLVIDFVLLHSGPAGKIWVFFSSPFSIAAAKISWCTSGFLMPGFLEESQFRFLWHHTSVLAWYFSSTHLLTLNLCILAVTCSLVLHWDWTSLVSDAPPSHLCSFWPAVASLHFTFAFVIHWLIIHTWY